MRLRQRGLNWALFVSGLACLTASGAANAQLLYDAKLDARAKAAVAQYEESKKAHVALLDARIADIDSQEKGLVEAARRTNLAERDAAVISVLGEDERAHSGERLSGLAASRINAWNRRASLLRALQQNPGEELRIYIEESISSLERAFQDDRWERDGDAAARLDPITPLPSAAEVATLADANNAATQRVAFIANAVGRVELAGTFLNLTNGRIPLESDDAASDAATAKAPFIEDRFARGLIAGILVGGLIVAALMRTAEV
jgi:hypothetical protein